ncbi:OmpA family protein [Sulfitobacter sp. M57]|uniref:OmpA family protein n=1 Tax=unclassified Sulfitobacter TaxID=196795 RepID=UPI0023E232E8|nr:MULTISPECIES: OmpA family protein [unclassified Sulfitobacter]MDF3416612.1 OmpA family protein [Sulfitobacter sp. KE5]MDF3424092.1 OmpA family protein [Sulfitobacter sp. KE43]MDF3435157.1 OmpA family protein [Sulfitobacter sp. KE42]MDF3460797.1 OmpA family protein [Sulfitobacter sp. S74]MDF3464694.1 OmpA family protein [Sulfitobacter sp. Ks18]
MFFLRTLTVATMAATLALIGQSAVAQSSLTADEIKDAFNKQKTRGLVIVPAGDAAQQPEAQAEVAKKEDYVAVEKADQVNVKISFDFDSAALRDDEKPKLASLCEAMKSVDVAVFQIIGHTDSSGSASYNENLSLLRAQEVKRHMVASCGIGENRLQAIGMGESAPFDADDPRSDANRRVEFQALG